MGVHRPPLPRRRRRPAPRQRRVPAPRRVVHGCATSSSRRPPAPPARRRRPGGSSPAATLMAGGRGRRACSMSLAAPVFSAFRLELVFVPMAAYGRSRARSWRRIASERRGGSRRPYGPLAAAAPWPGPSDPRPTARSEPELRAIVGRRRKAGINMTPASPAGHDRADASGPEQRSHAPWRRRIPSAALRLAPESSSLVFVSSSGSSSRVAATPTRDRRLERAGQPGRSSPSTCRSSRRARCSSSTASTPR